VASEAPTLIIGEPVGSAWREQALARIGEQRTMTRLLRGETELPPDVVEAYVSAIDGHLEAVEQAARSPRRLRAALTGAPIERVASNLDAVECDLLRLASPDYVREQMPSVLAHVRRHLRPADPRRVNVEALAKLEAKDWKPSFAETVIGAVHAASSKARRETRQVRSFRNTLWVATVLLAVAAGGMALLGILEPDVMQLCFNP
jgi:hypothetical protein